MASINVRRGKLVVDFRYQNKRCREQTIFDDTVANRRKLTKIVERMQAEITLGTFNYSDYFPNSKRGRELSAVAKLREAAAADSPTFESFAQLWFEERVGEWRKSYQQTVRYTLDSKLIPELGQIPVSEIRKAQIMEFRAKLIKAKGRHGKPLSHARINKVMSFLRMILIEASDRYEFTSPWVNIKPLKNERVDVQPFSMSEIKRFINGVRADFKNYYVVRFFTGMRTGEIDGLTWENVDFKNRQILVRQSRVLDEIVDTKTDGSFRHIDMNQPVFEALKLQKSQTYGVSEFVFCSPEGKPLQHRNVTQRVWYPTLKYLGIKARKPYQTRHTAASIWLAAGENAEWVARQLGHSNTQMLFKVYSRYVPNLTRQDGSLVESILEQNFGNNVSNANKNSSGD